MGGGGKQGGGRETGERRLMHAAQAEQGEGATAIQVTVQ
jgi:hypothetical protein